MRNTSISLYNDTSTADILYNTAGLLSNTSTVLNNAANTLNSTTSTIANTAYTLDNTTNRLSIFSSGNNSLGALLDSINNATNNTTSTNTTNSTNNTTSTNTTNSTNNTTSTNTTNSTNNTTSTNTTNSTNNTTSTNTTNSTNNTTSTNNSTNTTNSTNNTTAEITDIKKTEIKFLNFLDKESYPYDIFLQSIYMTLSDNDIIRYNIILSTDDKQDILKQIFSPNLVVFIIGLNDYSMRSAISLIFNMINIADSFNGLPFLKDIISNKFENELYTNYFSNIFNK